MRRARERERWQAREDLLFERGVPRRLHLRFSPIIGCAAAVPIPRVSDSRNPVGPSGPNPSLTNQGGPMSKHKLLGAGGLLIAVAIAASAYAAVGGPRMGPAKTIAQPSFQGYYDGHKDTYLNTDVSNKAEAKSMHINYSALIGKVKGLPEIYLVVGRAAPGQLAIFNSEPGEKTYSPLWDERLLTWKPGATPVLITADTQIDPLKKKGVLIERDGGAVLNCPIIKVRS
jgi:hypothetical protein